MLVLSGKITLADLLLLFFFFFYLPLFSFSQPVPDTLESVKNLLKTGEYKKSLQLIVPYNKVHPGHLNTQWLYAQTLYLAKKYRHAKETYRSAIAWHPENYYLRLDYAKKLADIGDFEEAQKIISLYLAYDSTATEAHLTLAKIYYWKGDFIQSCKALKKVVKKDPENAEARQLSEKLELATSNWLNIRAGYRKDDQPLQAVLPEAEALFYYNPQATYHAALEIPFLIKDKNLSNALWLRTGGQFHSIRNQAKFRLEGGGIFLPDQTIAWTAQANWQKMIYKNLSFAVGIEHLPYLALRINTSQPVMYFHTTSSLSYSTPQSWQGRVNFYVNRFPTNNLIYTAGGWLVSPPLHKKSALDVRLGYGFNYSDSKHNYFVPEANMTSLLSGTWNQPITGIYVPYFTPSHQMVHSAVALLSLRASQKWNLGVKGNVCFYGKNYIPYLFLNKNKQDQLYVAKDYYIQKYYPADLYAFATWSDGKKWTLTTRYDFLKTSFYTSHSIGLDCKMRWNYAKTK